MATKFSHQGLCVQDVEKSARFYEEVLQFARAEEYGYMGGEWLDRGTDIKDINVGVFMLRNPQGSTVELLHFKGAGAFGPRERRITNQYGLMHIAFFVTDLDASADKVERFGGKVVRATRTVHSAVNATVVYCTDPDGARIELIEVPGVPPAVSHSAICVDDIDASARFYQVLGFAPAEVHDLTDAASSKLMEPLTELKGVQVKAQLARDAQGNALEFCKFFEPKSFGSRERRALNQYGWTHYALRVDDIDAMERELVRAGGKSFPHTRGRNGNLEMLHLADPDGVRVELMQEHPPG